MTTPKQQYIKSLNDIAKRYGSLEDQVAQRAARMLKQLRAQIADQLLAVEGWDAYRLRLLDQNVERIIAQYEAQLQAELSSALKQTVRDGALSVVEPLNAIGVQGAFLEPTPQLVNTMLDYSAGLVKNITDEMKSKVNVQIRLAALGGKSPMDTMKAVTDVLGTESKAGVWAGRKQLVKGVAARSETIVRTEMQRAFNLSNYSQQMATAKTVPGLLKSWVATADSRTRDSHLKAHLQYRDNPIPIDEPFVLVDARIGRAELMYPGDPSAPAGFTINCRCRMSTAHPEVGLIGSSLDGRIAAERKRRQEKRETEASLVSAERMGG